MVATEPDLRLELFLRKRIRIPNFSARTENSLPILPLQTGKPDTPRDSEMKLLFSLYLLKDME